MDISFVFCTNDVDLAIAIASQLRGLSYLVPHVNMELIVVSPMEVVSKLEESSTARLAIIGANEPWGNRNRARNRGFQAARGRWVYFLDQDVRFPRLDMAGITARFALLEALPGDVWLVSGPYSNPPGLGYWGRAYNWLANLWLIHGPPEARVLAGNLLVRREISLSEPFNNGLMVGGEETDLCRAAIEAGGRSLVRQEMAMVHDADTTLRHVWQRLRTHFAVKRAMDPSFTRTPLSPRMGLSLLARPQFWPALGVYLLARVWR